MELFKVNVNTGAITRELPPDWLYGQPISTFQHLDTMLDPSYGLAGFAWFPGEESLPPLAIYQSYGDEVLTADLEQRVVLVSAAVVNWTAQQIADYKAPIVAAQWAAIKAARDGVQVEGGRSDGGVLVGGNWIHSDLISRVKWLGLKDSARDMLPQGALPGDAIVIDGAPVLWKTMAGTFVPVTVQMALDVPEAVKVLDVRIFKAAEMHKAQLMAAYDPATYDYTTGWPLRYVDTLDDEALASRGKNPLA